MRRFTDSCRKLCCVFVASLAAGCGGGGGGGSSSPPPPPPPPPPPANVMIAGTVTGLTGTGLELRNQAGAPLAIAGNGAFQFAGTVTTGTPYFVTVATQPNTPMQFCSIPNGAGLAGAVNTAINVICNSGTPRYLYVGDALQNTLYGIAVDGSNAALSPVALGVPAVTGQWPAEVVTAPLGANVTAGAGAFVYTRNANDGTVSAFAVNGTTGALTPVPGSPFTITGTANTVFQTVVSPTGRFLYFLIQGGTIQAYLIQANGALTAMPGSPFAVDAATGWINIDPLSRFIYGVASSFAGATVSAYRIDAATGALTAVGTPAPGTFGIARGVIHPSGQLLYVANETASTVITYRIDTTTGQLTNAGSVTAISTQPTVPRIHPDGRFLYVPSASAGVSGFEIEAVTGALTPVPNSPVLAGANVGQIDIDPTGQFLYAPVRIGPSQGIAAFTVNPATGQLDVIVGSPFPLGLTTSPTYVRAEPSGRYLFVASFDSDVVSSFAIDANTGVLTQRDSEPAGTNSTFLTPVGTQ